MISLAFSVATLDEKPQAAAERNVRLELAAEAN